MAEHPSVVAVPAQLQFVALVHPMTGCSYFARLYSAASFALVATSDISPVSYEPALQAR